MNEVRRRFKSSDKSETQCYSRKEKTKTFKPIPSTHFFWFLLLIVIVFFLVIVIEKRLPPALKLADEKLHPDKFIAESAYRVLKNLTQIGPRIAGSVENEILAVELLKNEINSIIKDANPKHIIELEIQTVSGDFNLEFLDGMTNVYRGLQNVIVRIGSRINSSHSLLINCHFDTVMDSPGASDDGAGCAVMMEILRVMSRSNKLLRHNIIFLFNGGEENFMPASHGFITQHRWAKEVRAFINLEACGAGGREVLFQAGPNHPWILETYSEQVPYPYASSLAQEIFQSGVIPGDTDYRIFRDFGKLSGLDFAWSANGYVYHTKFDNIDQIPMGSLQRTGDNILALAMGMAQGHQLSNVEEYRAGNLVFFDFLGAFVVRWPMHIADVINIATVIFSIYTLRSNVRDAEINEFIDKRKYCNKILNCVTVTTINGIISVLTALAIAFTVMSLGRTMSWYARPIWVFFLYVLPSSTVVMAGLLLHSKRYNKDLELSPWTLFQVYYDAYQLMWTLVLIGGIIARIRSSFIALLWVFAASLGNLLKSKLFGKLRDSKWLLLHISVMGLPFVQGFYLIIGALYLFIPIMGRAGAGSHAELLMAIMASMVFGFLFVFAVPIILLVDGAERVFSVLVGIFLISMGVLILTPLGFPYSGEPNSLAPQRFMIAHTKRTFHDETGAIFKESSGYWIADMDINSPHTVDNYVPEMKRAKLVNEECSDYLYCGLPYIVPVLNMIWKTHWIEGPSPMLPIPVKFQILERRRISEGVRMQFKVEGPTHMGIIISPIEGVDIAQWSLDSKHPLPGPLWNGRNTYFIYYAYGLEATPLQFSVDFKVPDGHTGILMDVAITSHYEFGPNKASPDLKKLSSQFPRWTAVTTWTSSYESWKI